MAACPKCSNPSPGPGPFCIHCGARLPAPAPQPAPPTLPISNAPPPGPAVWPAQNPPAAGMPPAQVPPGVQQPPRQQQYVPPPAPPSNASFNQPVAAGSQRVPLNIWGPFVGYGQRGRHVAWLMNDKGNAATQLRLAVNDRFNRRQVPGALVQPTNLVRQGILADTRSYFLIRRGLSTAGLYIDQFGRDLYVSQVTYFKGPISNLRILLLGLGILFFILYPPIWSSTLNSAFDGFGMSLLGGGGGLQLGGIAFLSCCIGPIYLFNMLALAAFAFYSLYKFITDKDILAGLRVQPNEFDVDDTVALERSVEQTVREALDAVGIEQKLMPQANEQSFQRMRLI